MEADDDRLALLESDALGLVDALGLWLALGLVDADGLVDALALLLALDDGERDAEGD